ncbi:aminoacyl-tRNA hydrolase [Methylobacter sp. YRD-M1]|uniref:aminoacyl-tRNA hydrolase n=1 Tax=Methylobacter sp. YRD-M1 TaxID=2911520 RepID=UPI00227C802B|nr:aminoacyl-tRNA hydrolase [Methylobacter sp. YRD-M1]WAK01765.1 aminoacyl-tRNA hydrolase [Methylobacter sp. YRD-M1]
MIKLIVGLGNPGRQYEKTRHNAGFLFLDELVSKFGCDWVNEPRFQGVLSEYNASIGKVVLLKPETFMNRSGQSVGKIVRYYKIMPEEILVVHDELDLDVGAIRLKKGGGHAGHNGLKDIIAHLGSREFFRLRIGVGRPVTGKVVADYVLTSPSKSEWELINLAIDAGIACMDKLVTGDVAAVMNKLHA